MTWFLDLLGRRFLSFMFDNIEYPPDTDLDEQIPDLFLNFIVSFNLQFTDESDNPVLASLEEKDVAKTFTEKILLLINREGKHLFVQSIISLFIMCKIMIMFENVYFQRTPYEFLIMNQPHHNHYSNSSMICSVEDPQPICFILMM